MSEGTLTELLAANPRLTGVLFLLVLLTVEAGAAVARCPTCAGP